MIIEKGRLKTRSEVDERFKWNLSAIYKDESEWQNAFSNLKEEINGLLSFKGKLHNSVDLEQFLEKYSILSSKHENVFVYAMLNFSEDESNEKWQEFKERACQLSNDYNIKTLFVKEELSPLTDAEVDNLINLNPNLKSFEYFLKEYTRCRPHVLSNNEEELLAQLKIALDKPEDIFSSFNNNNIAFPKIKNEKGEEIQLSHGLYMVLLRDKNRNIRRTAFEGYYQPFKQNIDVLANIYAANILTDAKLAKIRKYSSSLEMSLFPDNVDSEVYESLVSVVRENTDLVSKYNKLRIKELNLDQLWFYDMYVPLVEEVNKEYDFEEAIAIIRKSLAPLGEEYIKLYDKTLKEDRVDVLESKGKRSGAFSWGTYTAGGYTFLNYNGTLQDVSTLTHEIGHTLHRDLSSKNQPFLYYENPILLAEVASTFNECLLSDYLIKNAKTNKEKKHYIDNYIDHIRSTFFRQTMFADFELRVHELAERGEPIIAKTLTNLYRNVLREHLGPEMTIDENLDKEWSRIPHFYNSFYVYKYATSLSTAIALSQKVINGGSKEVEQYFNFLESGSHKAPLEILKDAGIDITKPDAFRVTTRLFEDLINQYETL